MRGNQNEVNDLFPSQQEASTYLGRLLRAVERRQSLVELVLLFVKLLLLPVDLLEFALDRAAGQKSYQRRARTKAKDGQTHATAAATSGLRRGGPFQGFID